MQSAKNLKQSIQSITELEEIYLSLQLAASYTTIN